MLYFSLNGVEGEDVKKKEKKKKINKNFKQKANRCQIEKRFFYFIE